MSQLKRLQRRTTTRPGQGQIGRMDTTQGARAAPMTAGNVPGSLTTQAANAKVTTGNRTNMYELAEAVHLRTTSKTRTNRPADPRPAVRSAVTALQPDVDLPVWIRVDHLYPLGFGCHVERYRAEVPVHCLSETHPAYPGIDAHRTGYCQPAHRQGRIDHAHQQPHPPRCRTRRPDVRRLVRVRRPRSGRRRRS